jgi:metal-dependent amidase/aminoacylase/carboxypeptidase family protein
MALAQEGAALTVSFQGPGGHSNGNYGRTSAVHAAARAITRMAETMDASSYAVSGFEGGNSVNSIASDARFTVQLKGDATAGRAALTAAVDAGVKAENDFRGVKPGDETGGVPAAISYTITP